MNISNNRLPNNIQIIHSSGGNNTSKDKKTPMINKTSVEFPALNHTQNYNTQGNSYQMHSIVEDDFSNPPVIKDNSKMINRIKSSIQPKSIKRLGSAIPSSDKIANKNIPMNCNLTGLMEENQKLKSELSKLKQELSNSKKEITHLESEIDKKDKLIDEVSTFSNNSINMGYGINNSINPNIINGINMKIIETKLLNGMKKQYKDLKKEFNKKTEEIEEMKRLLKTSKLNELSIENLTLFEELNKVKSFYKISVQENQNKLQLLRELENLQENFSKQQFMIISLQEKSERDNNSISSLKSEIMKDKAIIADRNKKIAELKRNLKLQIDYATKIGNFKENQEFIQLKKDWEKKINELKKDLSYFKQMNDKNGSRKKDLEDEIKRLKETMKNNNFAVASPRDKGSFNVIMDNPDDTIETKIQIYKSKLNEVNNEMILLEKENRDLKEQLGINNVSKLNHTQTGKEVDMSYLNNTKLKLENTNISSNLLPEAIDSENTEITLKEIEKMKSLTEDNFNEMIYILMKNFEANKIDSSVIESTFPSFENKTTSEIVQSTAKSIAYLLKNKNQEDIKSICQVLVTFIKKKSKDLVEFKKGFLSIFENISLFSGEQKAHFHKHLRRKFKTNKDSIIREFIASDNNIKKSDFPIDKELDINLLLHLNESDNIDKKYQFITFVDLRRIFDKLNISIEAELVEYLIYLMKSSFKYDKASLYDLNYLSLVELLYLERPDENDDEVSENNEEEHSYEITPEAYEKILFEIFEKIKLFAKKKKINVNDLFKEEVALVEEETTKERFNIIELKDFIEKLDNLMGLDLKELEIYCLYTKLKFDDVENDLEAISYDKLIKELENSNSLNTNKSVTNANKRLKLADMSMNKDKKSVVSNKVSLSQSGIFKQIDKKKENEVDKSKNESDNDNALNHSINIDIISLTEFIEMLKEYLEVTNKTVDQIKSKLIEELKNIQNNTDLITISLLNSFFKKEKIINGFINLNDLSDFASVVESTGDVNINIPNLFGFLQQVTNKNSKPSMTNEQTFKVNTNEKEDSIDKLEEFDKNEESKTDSVFDKEFNDALSNFDD